MSSERVRRILERQRQREEEMRQRDLKKDLENQKRTNDDPVRGNFIQPTGAHPDQVQVEVAKDCWERVAGRWQRVTTDRNFFFNPDHSSKESNNYKSPLTAFYLPSNMYFALSLRDAILHGKATQLSALRILHDAIKRFFVYSNISTSKMMWEDCMLAYDLLCQQEAPMVEGLRLLQRILSALQELLPTKAVHENYLKGKLETEMEKLEVCQAIIKTILNTYSPEVAISPGDVGLLRLPDEVLCNILSYLSTPDLLAVSATCKRLMKFGEDNLLFYRLYCSTTRSNEDYLESKAYKVELETYTKERNLAYSGVKQCSECGFLYWEFQYSKKNSCGCPRSFACNVQPSLLFEHIMSNLK